MFSTQEMLLIAGFAVLVVGFAIVAARMAGRSDETLNDLRAERETEALSPARPVRHGRRKEHRRR
jgi:hypothetical protein